MKVTRRDIIPEIVDIGNDILKVVLPQPFYASNNVYIIPGEELTIIDSGYIESIPVLQSALKTIKLSLKDIRKVIYTHNHIDHISASLVLKSYAPKAVYYGLKGMSEGIGNYIESVDLFRIASNDLFVKAFEKPEERNSVIESTEKYWKEFFSRFKETKKGDPILKMDVGLEQGDSVFVGEREIKILYTPGHNIYHITPYLRKEGIYFSGDLIISNLTAIYSEFDGDLEDYRLTLDRLLDEPIVRMLPAHGEEIIDPKRSINLVKKTLDILERGIVRRLTESSPSDLLNLMEAAIGKKVHSGGHLPTALALVYSIVKRLEKKKKIRIERRNDGYEKFYLTG